nr:MAG TPA: YopX protein [Caudoviricetes sp.]
MKDRYLFRAKRADNGEWVAGHLITDEQDDSKCFIAYVFGTDEDGHPHDTDAVLVDNSTICQCTGLKDKNGKLIWESDIVKDLFSDACAKIKYGSYQSCFDNTKTEHVGFYVDWSGKYTKRYRKDLGYWINMVNAEVIGNIFDNPELLESEEK